MFSAAIIAIVQLTDRYVSYDSLSSTEQGDSRNAMRKKEKSQLKRDTFIDSK